MSRDTAIFGAFTAVSALVVLIVFGMVALPDHAMRHAGRPLVCRTETTDMGSTTTCNALDGGP